MSKETGGSDIVKIDLLSEVLRSNALLILVLCNNTMYSVNYDELHTMLDNEWATRNKKGPSESKVKSQLKFLVKQNFLEVVEKKYQITSRGVQVATDLSPQARKGIHHSFVTYAS